MESGKNGCSGLNLSLSIDDNIGINLQKSRGFLNFIGALLLPTGLTSEKVEDGQVTGYSLSSDLINAFYGNITEVKANILQEKEDKGLLSEKANKNHESLVGYMLAEHQLKTLVSLLADPSGDKTVRKLVVNVAQREHWKKDGSIENFAKDFRFWYEVADSIENDEHGATFALTANGSETTFDLKV